LYKGPIIKRTTQLPGPHTAHQSETTTTERRDKTFYLNFFFLKGAALLNAPPFDAAGKRNEKKKIVSRENEYFFKNYSHLWVLYLKNHITQQLNTINIIHLKKETKEKNN
jgi:hypothetical protein